MELLKYYSHYFIKEINKKKIYKYISLIMIKIKLKGETTVGRNNMKSLLFNVTISQLTLT